MEIKEDQWAKFFHSGKEALVGMRSSEQFDIDQLLLGIKWPFGGMGSWNDSPPYTAYQFGREAEFNLLSDNLYKAIHAAIEAILNKL